MHTAHSRDYKAEAMRWRVVPGRRSAARRPQPVVKDYIMPTTKRHVALTYRPQPKLQRRLDVTSSLSFLNIPDLAIQQQEITLCRAAGTRGKDAPPLFSTETAYSKLTGDNKELLIISVQTNN